MELYVNWTSLQTLHLAVAANVAKLIISGPRISEEGKKKLADDLKAVISFSILSFAQQLQLKTAEQKNPRTYRCEINGGVAAQEAGHTPLNKSCLTQLNK